jgi:hypothetical protein
VQPPPNEKKDVQTLFKLVHQLQGQVALMNIAIDKQGAGLNQRLLTQVGDLNLALSKQG